MVDYDKVIHAFVDPFVEHKDAIIVRELPSESEKDVRILICGDSEDVARMIGRKGIIANAIREVVGVCGKTEGKHIHIKFESFGENEDEAEK